MKKHAKKLIKRDWMTKTKCKKYLCYPIRISGKAINPEYD